MLHWARAWTVPRGKVGASSPRCSAVPVAFSSSRSSGQGAEPRPLPLSYSLLDGEATLPAIVFLHGLFGSKTNFNSIAKAMVQRTGRRVLTVDARNHGDSPHNPDASYEAMSQDLQGLLPQLGLVPCVLVGHSMGGKTAMLLALQRDPAIRRFLLTNLVEVGGRFSWRVNLETLAQHLDKILTFPQQLESYSGPTLFLIGGNSRYVQPSHHSEIRRLFPQAQIQTVPNAGHWVHSDKPQDFMDAISSFLA
ncbi:protein ABHD11 isoform X2 [Microtus ochrogaster]|uniref:sn-1-specific diacylglycerol lipase ABHD11 n=1 Tax=Microtus ochrogaster TaxID=79684 RepID=A0ABM1APQ7_MICOH|nr:protein ABHD11 isoform X2 [Microtus ochrogaster]